MSRARIDILEPGLMTSVQDAGRWGHQRFGVPVCGVRDQIARRFANTLVGNRPIQRCSRPICWAHGSRFSTRQRWSP